MKNKSVIKQKILEEEDFIYCPRLGNSLQNLMDMVENSNGLSDDRICKILLISQKELDSIYSSAIEKLRKKVMGDVN